MSNVVQGGSTVVTSAPDVSGAGQCLRRPWAAPGQCGGVPAGNVGGVPSGNVGGIPSGNVGGVPQGSVGETPEA